MPETLKICKYNVSGTGYCDIFDDYCHEGPCSHETLVEYVAVVRCRECVKCGTGECPMEQDYPWISTDSDAFCSYGERRDDNDEEP